MGKFDPLLTTGVISSTAFLSTVILLRFAGGVCLSCERMVVWWCVNVCVEAMVNSPVKLVRVILEKVSCDIFDPPTSPSSC